MSNQTLPILQRENIDTIVSSAPVAYSENQVSHQRCLDAGNAILSAIHQQGMNDDLDQRAAIFIEKARATVKKMNTKRAPVTKLFDEIRTQYTILENDIDPTKQSSVPYQLQKLRNEYAKKKREEELQRQRAAMLQQQQQQARAKYRTDVEQYFRSFYSGIVNASINTLNIINADVTLENYDDSIKKINDFSTVLKKESFIFNNCRIALPHNITLDECKKICDEVIQKLLPTLSEQYESTIVDYKFELNNLLPSKKQELECAAKASAEEAERIRQEMARKEAEAATRREEERKVKEEADAQTAALASQKNEINSLFGAAQASVEPYQPKTSVKKKLVVLNPEGIIPVISLWWSEEGCKLSVDELTKMFKKQISFCEKIANKDGILVEDESVSYEDEVKVK